MGSLTQFAVMLFGFGIYILLFVLAIILVVSIKRIAKSQEETVATNKDIAKQLSIIARELERKNS